MSAWGTSPWGGVALDTLVGAPVISVVSPAPGQIPGSRGEAAATPIVFDVTDVSPDLQSVVLWLKFTRTLETFLIHDGTAFCAPFEVGSTRTAIANGYRFSVKVTGGWSDDFTLSVKAYDASGNET